MGPSISTENGCSTDVVATTPPLAMALFFCSETMLAVKDFLRVHEFHLVILEMQQDGTCEKIILGSGDHCLGNVFWDIQKKHASIVPSDLDVDTFETCVSSEPWTRSAVGTESSTHCCLKRQDKDSKKNTAEDEKPVMSLNPRQEEMRRVFRESNRKSQEI